MFTRLGLITSNEAERLSGAFNIVALFAIFTKIYIQLGKNPVGMRQSYAYYLLEGKNLCWNLRSGRQEQILECASKSWAGHYFKTLSTLGGVLAGRFKTLKLTFFFREERMGVETNRALSFAFF